MQALGAAHGVAHEEEGGRGGEVRFQDGGDVGEDEGGWAGEAALGGFAHGAAPSTLVERVYGYAAEGEVGEEFVVAVAVIREAVEEDKDGDGWGGGLGSIR